MKQLLSRLLTFLTLLFVGRHALPATQPPSAASPSSSIDAQVQTFAPAGLLRLAENPRDFQFDYFPTDLSGTGAYDYLVATYSVGIDGEKIRVLQNVGGNLQLAGVLDPSDKIEFVGFPTAVQLVYIDNSGIPAIEVENTGVDGRHFGFGLLRWTGARLVSVFPDDANMVDSYFADPDGSGVPEVINPPYCDRGECEGVFEVYRLKDGKYVLTATSTVDPSGLIPPLGENLPLPDIVTAQPDRFSAAEILSRATTSQAGVDVVLRFGNLVPMDGRSTQTDVSEVDLSSIYAGRNLKPSRVQIVGAAQGKREGFDGAFIEAILPRSGVLQFLSKAQPSKPPAPGEVVTLPVHARLKDGLALYGFAPVNIVGPASK